MQPISYPIEAGLSAGGSNYSLYVMQETHYNNPDLIANRADSSGMRLYYTSKLRPNDIGILEVGLEYSAKNSIPPGQANFELQGHCVPECTRVGLPERGINVIASQLHTHLTGESFSKCLMLFEYAIRGCHSRMLFNDVCSQLNRLIS